MSKNLRGDLEHALASSGARSSCIHDPPPLFLRFFSTPRPPLSCLDSSSLISLSLAVANLFLFDSSSSSSSSLTSFSSFSHALLFFYLLVALCPVIFVGGG